MALGDVLSKDQTQVEYVVVKVSFSKQMLHHQERVVEMFGLQFQGSTRAEMDGRAHGSWIQGAWKC